MATLRDMFKLLDEDADNAHVFKSLYRGAWNNCTRKACMLQNKPAVLLDLGEHLLIVTMLPDCDVDLTQKIIQTSCIDMTQPRGLVTGNRFVGFDKDKSVMTDVVSNDNKYIIMPSTETQVLFVDIWNKPELIKFFAKLFIWKMPTDPFTEIQHDTTKMIKIRAPNVEFEVPKTYLRKYSPLTLPKSHLIDLPFEVPPSIQKWFIDRLTSDKLMAIPRNSDVIAAINLIHVFKITL